MNEPRKTNAAVGVGVFIVVVVLFVIGTVLFNAIRDKREYDEAHPQRQASAATASANGAAQ